MRSNGGIIGAKQTVSVSAASGIWSIRDQQREKGASNWPRYADGLTADSWASSAYLLKTQGQNTDGLYWINDGVDIFQVYCDMTRYGGGWMLAASIRNGNDNEVMNTGAAGLSTPVYQPSSTANWGKFSDARINRMRSRSQTQANGYTGNWPWWMEGVGYTGGDINNWVYKDAQTFSVNTKPDTDATWRRIRSASFDENSTTYYDIGTPNSGTWGWGHHHIGSINGEKRSCWARHPEQYTDVAWNTDSWGRPTYGHVWVK